MYRIRPCILRYNFYKWFINLYVLNNFCVAIWNLIVYINFGADKNYYFLYVLCACTFRILTNLLWMLYPYITDYSSYEDIYIQTVRRYNSFFIVSTIIIFISVVGVFLNKFTDTGIYKICFDIEEVCEIPFHSIYLIFYFLNKKC